LIFDCDFLFANNLDNIKPVLFYYLIRKNHIYLKDINEECKFFCKISLKDAFKRKLDELIDSNLKSLYKYILEINKDNIDSYIKCALCNQYKKDGQLNELFYLIKNKMVFYYHKNCYDKRQSNKIIEGSNTSNVITRAKNIKNEEILIDYERYNVYNKYKESLLSKIKKGNDNNMYNIIEKYFQNCEDKFKYLSKIFDEKTILDEIESIKESSAEQYYEKMKNILIEKEQKFYDKFNQKKEEYKKIYEEWKNYWITKINCYIKDNNIKNYIKIICCKKLSNDLPGNRLSDWKIEYEVIEYNKKKTYVNLYEIIPCQDSSDLALKNNKELGEESTFENYFPSYNKSLIINKDRDKLKIKFKKKIIEKKIELYDYDKMSDTLILYRQEDKEKKLGIYCANQKPNTINCNEYISDSSVLNKILLVPCYPAYEKQSVLLFIDNEIHLIQINSKTEYPKIINLLYVFKDYNTSKGKQTDNSTKNGKHNDIEKITNQFEELQFIIYFDFLLILKFDDTIKNWKGKIFSLSLEDDSLFDFIKEIDIDEESSSAKFSFSEMKEIKYLFSVDIKMNIPQIHFWEINSKLSGISTDYQKRNKRKNDNTDISLGNCVINYFYHCFEKYPLLGALQYKLQKYEKKSLKFSFYIKNDLSEQIDSLKKYIDELKVCCQNKKKISFHDMNFSFDDYKKYFIKKESTLGNLLIKILEVTPIQIAKIMEHEFKIMSNGENIENRLIIESKKRLALNKEAKFNIQNYSQLINFSIKDSILNYFELPVVVICCFGTQSIGKSTFLNELSGSLFNVSGMRCTEGIWMSLNLYFNNKNIKKSSCNNKCLNCKKKKCEQLNHGEIKLCLCNDCSCNEKCFLNENEYNTKFLCCLSKCCLKKGHEKDIKCSYENCKCNCVCECICEKKSHRHICHECSNNRMDYCECDCNCKHICGISIISHNFICICLDFEGLGTFERTNEQDIQMALVGSALGNNVIFRTGNTFDRFTESTLQKLALGSHKLKNVSIEQFFGGSLLFSPKDVNPTDKNKLKDEFDQKIENSVKKWSYSLSNSNENKLDNKYTIFGLFEDNVFAPTPIYPDESFYKTLRENLIKEIIENTLKFKRNPIYRTGKEFYSNLKLFLSAVYMNEYEFLTNYREKFISEYICENIDKAFEIGGILKFNNINELKKSLLEENEFKYYIKKEYMQELETNFLINNKYKINNSLIIENIITTEKIQGNYKSKKYGIDISITNISGNNTYTMSIKNFNDYGLILQVFEEIKNILNKENLTSNLFNIWDNICKTIGFNDKTTIIYFNLFITSIIKRRKDNVKNWLEEITKEHDNLKDLRNQYSNIDNIWTLCRQKCKYCYYNCCLLQDHEDEHKCPYDHKCKEICSLCIKSQCNDKNCEHSCIDKSGHPDFHECGHYHQCNDNCVKKEYSKNCKGRCMLKLGHENEHDCGLETHYCKSLCDLNSKTKNCKKYCNLIYPHEGKEHNCGKQHLCIDDCKLKEKTKGCKNFCSLVYGHKGDHLCGEKHFCKDYCSLKDKTFGCKETCNLNYGHEGDHNCEAKHFCKDYCSLKDKSLGCQFKCNLEPPHEGKDHICSGKHICNKLCQFSKISKFCNQQCSLEYNHSGGCICSFPQEIHICNKKCYNCGKDCILNSGHEEQCKCGKCKCPKSCKYEGCSRNCKKKCKYKAGHPESDGHICNAKHLCNNECWLKNYSLNCEGYCASEINNHMNHICNIPIEKHGCNGICAHFNNSRNCKKQCSREVNHSGIHLCEININNHLCKNKCDLFMLSINCNQFCNLPINHKGNHICGVNKHLCKNKCSLLNNSRSGCDENCCLNAGHYGQCFCKKSKESHICNNKCILSDKSKGCKLNCNLSVGHKGDHQCEVTKEDHICKGICSLKERTRGKCYTNCCLPYNHEDFCICTKEVEHLCDKKCFLFNKSQNCKEFCNKPYGHKDEHLCDKLEKHLCNKKCYFFRKCKGNCKEYCKLEYEHFGKCNCKIKDGHLCNNNCFYFRKSRGCNKECSLEYEHGGPCKCNVKEEFHFCIIKCELCKTSECGHVFNHINKEMNCCKCKDKKCSLTGKKKHFCGNQHDCKEKCKAFGWCKIESSVQLEEKTYTSRQGEEIKYKAKKTQEILKNNCSIKIKENEESHGDKHICDNNLVHKCGYQCPQCEYYCTESVGHYGLHNCFHGNIKNSYISLSNYGSIATINKEKKKYQFQEGEKALIFFCDEYCKEQGQGHIHQFISYDIVENENVRLVDEKNHIYECKCLYYWEYILKFKGNFTTEEQKKFSLCNWKCKYSSHQTDEYCQLPLWHQRAIFIPKDIYGKWIYEGHIFKCSHPIGVYSIFLIDQSGSMDSKSDKPTNIIIKEKLDNMLGSSIQAISNFCKIRSSKSIKDKCSLIGFNNKAKIILKDVQMNNNEMIINDCLSNLHPDGCTYFSEAFKESNKILEKVDRNEFIPIIILLTDGLDHSYKSTKPYVEKVSIYF